MKFLLNANFTKSSKTIISQTNKNIINNANTYTSAGSDSCSGSNGSLRESTKLYGEAISPVCGCICKVNIDMSGEQTMNNIKFENLRLLLNKKSQPLVTQKGNLLVRDCHCKPLSLFSSFIEDHCSQRSKDALHNEVFRSGVPSAFARTVRRRNKLPLQSENCLRLVNEAICDALGSTEEEMHKRKKIHWPRPGSYQFFIDEDPSDNLLLPEVG